MPVPYLKCMLLVASFHNIPPRVLPSIQAVEGGAVGSVHRNTDGSEDLGLMQVNTLWLGSLARYTGQTEATVRARLINEPCFNIAAAGAILRGYLNETGGDLMQAVGDYHSHTPGLNIDYQAKVKSAAARMFGQRARTRRP
jgi:soluble lytic murein transglycosylase-like protein